MTRSCGSTSADRASRRGRRPRPAKIVPMEGEPTACGPPDAASTAFSRAWASAPITEAGATRWTARASSRQRSESESGASLAEGGPARSLKSVSKWSRQSASASSICTCNPSAVVPGDARCSIRMGRSIGPGALLPSAVDCRCWWVTHCRTTDSTQRTASTASRPWIDALAFVDRTYWISEPRPLAARWCSTSCCAFGGAGRWTTLIPGPDQLWWRTHSSSVAVTSRRDPAWRSFSANTDRRSRKSLSKRSLSGSFNSNR